MKQDTLPPSALYLCQTGLVLHQMPWQQLGASSAHGFAALSSLCDLTVTSLAKQESDRAVLRLRTLPAQDTGPAQRPGREGSSMCPVPPFTF